MFKSAFHCLTFQTIRMKQKVNNALECGNAMQRLSWQKHLICTWEKLLTQPSHLHALDLFGVCAGEEEKEGGRDKEPQKKKKRRTGKDLEETDSKRNGTKTNKKTIMHRHRWLRLQAAIFSRALPGRSCKVSVRVRAGCFSGPPSHSPGPSFIFPQHSCFFNHPTTLSCMSMAWFQSTCKALSPP